ncbi:MAG: right-handed parallel beta-helix repeat-containing protein [Candidatus Tenebribacter burtonii]|nr:right-handed parallel beta-helix repeat-containing protein [Candidatus Tenebribacter burtonii]
MDITTSITVASGVTMTIQPGATLIFHPEASLTINGTLIAQATSANHITFTSSQVSPQKGDWDWIDFDNSSGANVLEYCDIEYARIGLRCMNNSQLSLKNVTVTNCQNYGLFLLSNPTSYISVENCYFTNNNDYGIWLYNTDPDIVNVTCTNNNYGLFCYNGSNPIVGHSSFSNNNQDGIYDSVDLL